MLEFEKLFSFLTKIAALLLVATSVSASPCEGLTHHASNLPHLKAGSVPNNELDQHLNASEFVHGIMFNIEQRGENLFVDIIEYPKEAQLAAGLFALLQIARLAETDFNQLVLIDSGKEMFAFDGEAARKNGCQALWGTSEAGSPLPLFVDIMATAKDTKGDLLIPAYTGNWLSDMNIALEAFNGKIAPKWIFSAAK